MTSRSFGRYGVGVKAALLYASVSLEALGVRNATPLFIATATVEAKDVTSAHFGLGGTPPTVLVADRRELFKLSDGGSGEGGGDALHGTFARLNFGADAHTARARAAGEALVAYFARLALLPRAGGAYVEFSLDAAASEALGCGSLLSGGVEATVVAPSPLRVLSRITNEALHCGRAVVIEAAQLLGGGGGGGGNGGGGGGGAGGGGGGGGSGAAVAVTSITTTASCISIIATGIEDTPGWQTEGREQLARALRVPLACVAVAAARAKAESSLISAEVRVWIALTPERGLGGGAGVASPASRECALVHILRFASGVPLLGFGAGTCALSRGAADASVWASIGLTLERAARGTASRRTAAALSAAPAAPTPHARRSVSVDAPGAWIASSAVVGFPLVPFAEARVLIDISSAPGAPPQAFTDLAKVALRLGRGARCPAALTRVATRSAFAALRAQLPANLLEPASVRHLRLLRDVYLPDVAAQLAAALGDAGEGSSVWRAVRLAVETAAGGELPGGSFVEQLDAVRRFLAARLDAQADLVLSVADEAGGVGVGVGVGGEIGRAHV